MTDPISAIYFDIETCHPDPNWNINEWGRKERLPITCAAALVVLMDGRGKPVLMDKLWHAGMQLVPNKSIAETIKEIGDGVITPTLEMNEAEVGDMLDFLIEILEGKEPPTPYPPKRRPLLFTWNGMNFDFPAIASNVPDRLEDVLGIAEKSYDPCFQFIRQFGWPIGIPAIAEAMLGKEKAEGMVSADAQTLWATDPARVLRYVMGDVGLLGEIVEAIRAEKQVRWINKKGKESANPIKSFMSVTKAMRLREPERTWMQDPERFELGNIISWMNE